VGSWVKSTIDMGIGTAKNTWGLPMQFNIHSFLFKLGMVIIYLDCYKVIQGATDYRSKSLMTLQNMWLWIPV